ncbi:MAG: acetate--CoA ligase family protein, partial [Candidatus Dormibacteraceae bacterium]
PLLEGWRGRPPLDVGAAARAARILSEVIAAHPEISELEINPLRVAERGALAVDVVAFG